MQGLFMVAGTEVLSFWETEAAEVMVAEEAKMASRRLSLSNGCFVAMES
jgi:hypothetical protein